MLNRPERNRIKRELQKMEKVIKKLSPNEMKLVDQLATYKANEKIDEKVAMVIASYSRVVNASLVEHGFDDDYIDKIFELASEFMEEEDIKAKKLNEELRRSENIEMTKKKIEDGILTEINDLMDAGKNKKEVIEAVLFKFPSMSKAMIINAYQEVKESRKKEDPEINEAAEEILNIMEEGKKMEDKEVEKVPVKADKVLEETSKDTVNSVVVSGATVEKANLNPPVDKESLITNEKAETKGLKVLSMTLKGENGTYRACENGVELTEMGSIICFENIEQVDKWANEVKQVFEMLKA